ncbi:hypothetical protein GQ53DRAFT_136186 [Thozetella sp. PMI_491]|nr:hypothetical protein GQ53DRAFT_136186 [Thozetella sp. PMI_491]
MVLTCRDLEIEDAYDELDTKAQSETGIAERLKRKLFGELMRTLYGDRAYRTDSRGLHTVNGYPAYVKWARNQ